MKCALFLLLMTPLAVHAGESCTSEQVAEQRDINTNVPNHLKGAKIIIRQADGSESIVPAEKFKVVPRKQQFVTTKTTMLCRASEKNRVAALGGYGPTGALKNRKEDTKTTVVDTKEGVVGGLQYQRKLNDKFSLGVQGQSNKTFSLIFGFDF
jgi:hypothetical protein